MPFIVAVDPAAPDEPPLVVTLRDGLVRQVERGRPPTSYLKPALDAARPRITEAFRRALADGQLFPDFDDIEPMDLTAPAQHMIRVASPPTFIPLFPAVDIHPNGGIPG